MRCETILGDAEQVTYKNGKDQEDIFAGKTIPLSA